MSKSLSILLYKINVPEIRRPHRKQADYKRLAEPVAGTDVRNGGTTTRTVRHDRHGHDHGLQPDRQLTEYTITAGRKCMCLKCLPK